MIVSLSDRSGMGSRRDKSRPYANFSVENQPGDHPVASVGARFIAPAPLLAGITFAILCAFVLLFGQFLFINVARATGIHTFYGGYRTVEEMEAFLDQKASAYPGLAEKVD